MRGFREDRLGPLDARGNPTGGNATAIVNAEWRFPIWRWFGGAVFIDSGNVTPEIGDLTLDSFKSAAGGGLRVKTPVGPGAGGRGVRAPVDDREIRGFTCT